MNVRGILPSFMPANHPLPQVPFLLTVGRKKGEESSKGPLPPQLPGTLVSGQETASFISVDGGPSGLGQVAGVCLCVIVLRTFLVAKGRPLPPSYSVGLLFSLLSHPCICLQAALTVCKRQWCQRCLQSISSKCVL